MTLLLTTYLPSQGTETIFFFHEWKRKGKVILIFGKQKEILSVNYNYDTSFKLCPCINRMCIVSADEAKWALENAMMTDVLDIYAIIQLFYFMNVPAAFILCKSSMVIHYI